MKHPPLGHNEGNELEVPAYTAAQIRAALEEHYPSSSDCELCGMHTVCSCDYKTDWTTSHVLDALKKFPGRA